MRHAIATIATTRIANGGGVAFQFRNTPLAAASHVEAIHIPEHSTTRSARRIANRASSEPARSDRVHRRERADEKNGNDDEGRDDRIGDVEFSQLFQIERWMPSVCGASPFLCTGVFQPSVYSGVHRVENVGMTPWRLIDVESLRRSDPEAAMFEDPRALIDSSSAHR
jgi:hypothetical protein